MVIRAPASAGLSCSSMASRTWRRAAAAPGSSPARSRRSWPAAAGSPGRWPRPWPGTARRRGPGGGQPGLRGGQVRADLGDPLFRCAGTGLLAGPQRFPAATAAWYFSITAAWAASAWASRRAAASAACRARGDPGVRAARRGGLPARPACPAPRAAGPAWRPARPAAAAARRPPRQAAVIIIIIVIVVPQRLLARAVRLLRAGQPRPGLRLDRGLQRGDLRRQLPGVQVREPGRVPGHRGPVDRRAVPFDRARGGQQPQHLHEQPLHLGPVPAQELRDRPVAGHRPAADHPAAQVIDARVADLPRGPDPLEIAVEHQRQHHRRVIRRLPLPVGPVRRGEPRQVQLAGHREHLPGQVVRRQPGPDVGRQQAALVRIHGTEPSSHNSIIP